MNGIYYALTLVGVLLIIRWFIQNDGKSGTSGLLAMKPDQEKNLNGDPK